MALLPGPLMPGETQTASLASGSKTSLVTATGKDVITLSLAPGAWDVRGTAYFTFGTTTSFTALQAGISTAANTLGAEDTFSSIVTAANVPTAALDMGVATPTLRINCLVATTVRLVVSCVFTVSTLQAYGTIRAFRVR